MPRKKRKNPRAYFVVITAFMIVVLSNLYFLSLGNMLGDSIFQVTLCQKQRNISNHPLLLHVTIKRYYHDYNDKRDYNDNRDLSRQSYAVCSETFGQRQFSCQT